MTLGAALTPTALLPLSRVVNTLPPILQHEEEPFLTLTGSYLRWKTGPRW